MVSQGRALAYAAVGIVVPATVAAVLVHRSIPSPRDAWEGFLPTMVVAAIVLTIPVALLTAAIVIARRGDESWSAARLGARAALTGLSVGAVLVPALLAAHLLL